MSMNKFMHPRNIYRTPPDFKQLAIDFEEFRNVSKMNINGNVHIDFKNEVAVRILTQCLLKKDFNLNVHLPAKNLIPTLSLRLNYILWIEDILRHFGLAENAIGIDIGCGASCIYPLLAMRQNPSWRMFAAEIDDESIACAADNIKQNQLHDSIELVKANEGDEPFDALSRCGQFETADFSVCNPPFFTDDETDADDAMTMERKRNRTGHRKGANNAKSGVGNELVTAGGEIAFVKRLIRSSRSFSDRIKVFTSMLGHKSSLAPIQNELNAQQICNFATTQFCQGRTMRWAIAWTFQRDLLLRTVPQYGSSVEKRILRHAIDVDANVERTTAKLISILDQLEQTRVNRLQTLPNRRHFHVVAESDSWSKQRQKKRAAAMMEKRLGENGSEPAEKRLKQSPSSESVGDNKPPHLHVLVGVEDDEINLEYLNGCGGIGAAYQLLQFIKNKWSENVRR